MSKDNNQPLNREQIVTQLSKGVSPAELSLLLQQLEVSDKKDTIQLLEQLNKEFESNGGVVEEILVPVFCSIIDGFLECSKATRKLRRKGLTASRIVQECKAFSYPVTGDNTIIQDAYTEYKNIGDRTNEDFVNHGQGKKYDRAILEDKTKMNQYKEESFANNGGKINATDEYTRKKNVYASGAMPDQRRNIQKYKHSHRAETDHIEPLARIHERFKGNYALTDKDIKEIANQEANFALTSARINRGAGAPNVGGKFDKTPEEFVRDQTERERKGLPNLGLTEEQKRNILRKGKEARKAIDKSANQHIAKNLVNTEIAPEILKKTSVNASSQAGDVVIGNIILFTIKPLYYEISDIVKNGMQEGVEATSTYEALKIRMTRLKNYVCDRIIPLVEDNIKAFIVSFISSLIEGIISLFVGIFKQVLKLAKEGLKICAQSVNIIFGKDSAQLNPAEKGDAIIKLIGGSVIALCGIGIETWMNSVGIPDPWSTILATTLSGIASVLFMVLLDRLDLFSVKAQKRHERIEEIFAIRIAEIKLVNDTLNTQVVEALAKSQMCFNDIKESMYNSMKNNDMDSLFIDCKNMAKFYKTELPFSTIEEGVDYIDRIEKIVLTYNQ